ncbi:MAG: UvrD-helicase domain-containing protein [Chlorobiaceae bacterium]|nr:UvrD-helicase domain-containing protein [Chlorobiaceae bacterium]
MHEAKLEFKALNIVSAAAGTGKTHCIQETLAEWVRTGHVAPDRIVAVTFTETAAAELQTRIREALVSAGMLEEALRLDNAYISTIHSFGLRLIGEFAFDAGISPSPRLLNDDEVRLLLGRALATSDRANTLVQGLDRHGYKANHDRTVSTEDRFRKRVLALAGKLRAMGSDTGCDTLTGYAETGIRTIYGETHGEQEPLRQALYQSVATLMEAFPGDLTKVHGAKYGVTIHKKLTSDFRQIAIARAGGGEWLEHDWKLWQYLRKLRQQSTRQNPLPEGYADAVTTVISMANSLPEHPGPLVDAVAHAVGLLEATVDLLGAYSLEKKQRGLVDYTDMVSEAYRMLVDPESPVSAALSQRLGCLVVDEFQDTNPLQFSLLWSLTRGNLPTVVVGDLKQAIMGFQDADSRLFERLCGDNPADTTTQSGNFRSSAQLMEWINLVGKGLFGENYTELAPKAPYESRVEHPLEVIESARNLKPRQWAAQTVLRISELLNADPSVEVYDKHLKAHRPLRGGDIAVLCFKNDRLKTYAEELRRAGVRCRLQEEGWLDSRIVQLVWHCLSYIADPGDLHAALYLSATELGHSNLAPALSAVLARRPFDGFPFTILDEAASGSPDRTVGDLLDEVIDRLDLYGVTSAWPNAREARANLLRLSEECLGFMSANRDAMASGGYHGTGVKTFQSWLKGKVARDRDGDLQPEPSVGDDDAVQLMTWHRSKGREWPVVCVCGLDQKEFPRLPAETVEYPGFEGIELSSILDHARIGIYPEFDAPEQHQQFQAGLWDELGSTMDRLLYVAMTRAREKVILEWPSAPQKDEDKMTYFKRFVARTGAAMTPEGMQIAGGIYPCRHDNLGEMVPDPLDAVEPDHQLPTIGRRAITPAPLPDSPTPELYTPSSLHNSECAIPGGRREEVYGRPLVIDFPGITDPQEKGKILHRAFEVLSQHPERKVLLSDAVGRALTTEQADAIAGAVTAFDRWIAETLKPLSVNAEVPLLTLDGNGSVVTGFADMLVETADGIWIVDHKSDQVTTPEILEERFRIYYPQLKCYADALATVAGSKPVRGFVVNWLSFGMVSVLEIE